MLEQGDICPRFIGRLLNKLKITYTLIGWLTSLGVKWLHGIKGHTMLVVLKKN
jgi:hypothetical protein